MIYLLLRKLRCQPQCRLQCLKLLRLLKLLRRRLPHLKALCQLPLKLLPRLPLKLLPQLLRKLLLRLPLKLPSNSSRNDLEPLARGAFCLLFMLDIIVVFSLIPPHT